jgi:hypothetical protein
MVTSADYLHVHPLRMQPRDGTEAKEFSSSLPLDEPEPRLSKSPERELTCGWQSGTRYPRHGKETGSYKAPPEKSAKVDGLPNFYHTCNHSSAEENMQVTQKPDT